MSVSGVGRKAGPHADAVMAVRKNESMGVVDAALAGLGGPRSAALLDCLDSARPIPGHGKQTET